MGQIYRVHSRNAMAITYKGGADGAKMKHSVTLQPGVNELSEQDSDLLSVDPFFRAGVTKGLLLILDKPAPQVPDPVADPAPAPAPTIGDKAAGTKGAKGAAKAAAEKAAANQALLEGFKALDGDKDSQDAYLASLTDEQRAVVTAEQGKQ